MIYQQYIPISIKAFRLKIFEFESQNLLSLFATNVKYEISIENFKVPQ